MKSLMINLGKKCKLGFVDITNELTIKNSKIVAQEIFAKCGEV